MAGMFDNILSGIGGMFGGSTVVSESDPGQKGGGKFSSDFAGALITAGTGLAQSYFDQKSKRKALEQANKQAEDQYKLQQEALARGGGSASAQLELAKKKLMMDAYQVYSDSYARAGQAAQTGWGKVADSMQTPLLMRAR